MNAWTAACWSRTVTRWGSGTTWRGWQSSGRCPPLSVLEPTPEALGCPLWSAYALAFSPEIRDAQQCLDVLDKLGAAAVRRAVLRDRHARGLAVPRGPRPASRANPAGLTAREAEVLQLLADGLSYAEVAERLVLSEKTVGHHVSAVLRKLGEPTRSRAVAAALRLGVIAPR